MQLISTIKRQMKPVMTSLLADSSMRESITYKKYISEAFDATEGHNIVTTSDTSLTGVVIAHTKESLAVFGAETKVQEGDKAYIFDSDDCPDGMSLKDWIINASSIKYSLKDITPVYGIVTIVTIEGSR